jgi:hypothetical protein
MTGNMTCYFAHPKRGSKAMNDMGILPEYDGTIVHDFWSSYYKYSCMHAFCNAHLLRELTGIYENYDQQWSQDMGDLLIEIKECVDEAPEMSESLEADQIKNFEEKYDHITKAGLEENPLPLISPTNKKKRGRKKQSKSKNLLDRFVSYKDTFSGL